MGENQGWIELAWNNVVCTDESIVKVSQKRKTDAIKKKPFNFLLTIEEFLHVELSRSLTISLEHDALFHECSNVEA